MIFFIYLVLFFSPSALAISPKADDLPSTSHFAEISPQFKAEILARVNEKPLCFPSCSVLEHANILITEPKITIGLIYSLMEDAIVPLPLSIGEIWPEQITMDGKILSTIKASDNSVFALLPKGIHQVNIVASIPKRDSFTLNFPLAPRFAKVQSSSFDVLGINDDGSSQTNIQFVRKVDKTNENFEKNSLSPFFRVTRDIYYNLDSSIETTIERMSPLGDPAIVEIPLLDFEDIVTPNMKIKDRRVTVSFEPFQSSASWNSRISNTSGPMNLKHQSTSNYSELWRVKVSPLWHLNIQENDASKIEKSLVDGFDVVFKPWPEQKATLLLEKPKPVDAPSMTIESSLLSISPGTRSHELNLRLAVDSSRGFQHTIEVPADLELTNATINQSQKNLTREGKSISIPIYAGRTMVHLKFRTEGEYPVVHRVPEINLKTESVNGEVKIMPPSSRWIVWTGGKGWGPVVLIWNQLIIALFLSFIFSRLSVVPIGFFGWSFMMVGLTQTGVLWLLLPAATLLALAYKKTHTITNSVMFNLRQLALMVLVITSMVVFYMATKRGLLGLPTMYISGNGSTAHELIWYQDRLSNLIPQPYYLSLPIFYYRALMLVWSLWIAWTFIKIAPWIWQCLVYDGIWKKIKKAQIILPEKQIITTTEPPK